MKMRKLARLLLAAAPLLAGCGNFWQAPSSTTTTSCTTNCSTATSGNFYLLNTPSSGSSTIVGESFVSGSLTAISGSSWTVTGALAMAMAPNGDFLCVSTNTTNGVEAFPISRGVLGTGVTASSDEAVEALSVVAGSSHSWLVEASPISVNASDGVIIAAIPINSTTGLNAGNGYTLSITDTSATVHQLVISPDKTYVLVALGEYGTEAIPFNANASSASPFGSPSQIGVANTASYGSAISVAVDPTNRLFYIGETLADPSDPTLGGLRAFTFASLSTKPRVQASGSPIASGGLAPNSILPVSTPNYVYVANGEGGSKAGNITGFKISGSGSSYTIATGSTTTVGVSPLALAVDSTGAFLMDVGEYSPYFDSFTFDSTTTGQLDVQTSSTSSASFTAIVAQP